MKHLWWAFRYAWLTVKHKWFVFQAGFGFGVPLWRLVIHDVSKFGFSEVFAYGRQFFGDKGDPDGFAAAWLHHQNMNPHHWEYWVTRSGHNRGKGGEGWHEAAALPMPETYVLEMVADWMGASRAYTGSWEMGEWLSKNLWRMNLHQDTVEILKSLPIWESGYSLDRPWRCYAEQEKEEC